MLSTGILAKESLWRSCELSLGWRPEVAGLDCGCASGPRITSKAREP